MLGWIAFAVLCGTIGYGAGLRRGQRWLLGEFQASNQAQLTLRVETLSLLQLGETAHAILSLEGEADGLARTIAGAKRLSENLANDQHALSYYKTYLDAVPPSPDRARELAFALEGLPLIQPGKCQNNLKALLSRPPAIPAK
jgi:hypothetical protein